MLYSTVHPMKKTIQTKLDERDIVKLKDIARKQGHTLSSIIRYVIKLFLAKEKT